MKWRRCKKIPDLNRKALRLFVAQLGANDSGLPYEPEAILDTTMCLYYHVRTERKGRLWITACLFIAIKLADEVEGLRAGNISNEFTPREIVDAELEIFRFFNWKLPLREIGLVK